MQIFSQIQNIVSHIQIKSADFLVAHPNYRALHFTDDLISQLRKLSENLQDEYLRSLLTQLIFAIYCNDTFVIENSPILQSEEEIWLQNLASEVDWQYCEQLNSNNLGTGWWNPKFEVVKQEADGSLAVQKKGITTHIQRKHHLRLEEQSAAVGDIVSVFTPPYQIINKFYAAFGNSTSAFSDSLVFIYFNFSPEGAVKVMKYLTTQLNTIDVSFIFNVLHNPRNYGRYDSGFLRFDKHNYELVRQILQTVYRENKLHFHSQVPLLTKVIAPGIGLGEKPEEEFKFLDDLGMNRCQIIANGLLEAHKSGDESSEARMKYILKQFDKYGIDIERPYLKPNSEDIYTPLDLD